MRRWVLAGLLPTVLLSGCAGGLNPPTRMGMVKDPETGLMFGSVVEKNFVTDPSFYENRRIKVRIRNTSGDVLFDLDGFQQEIERAYRETGYIPTRGDDFGLLLDVNVMYSGHAQTNLSQEFGFLGATGAGLIGASRNDGALPVVAGAVAGATLGSVIGSFATNDTYTIVTNVTVGIVEGPSATDGKRITFSRSPSAATQEANGDRRKLEAAHQTGIAVYAGGRSAPQSRIAGEVRQRLVRILRDII